jgi:hypothetical protein
MIDRFADKREITKKIALIEKQVRININMIIVEIIIRVDS